MFMTMQNYRYFLITKKLVGFLEQVDAVRLRQRQRLRLRLPPPLIPAFAGIEASEDREG